MKSRLAAAGLLGGIFWIVLAFFPPVGARETREYEILWNRFWTPALLGILAGFSGQFLTVRPSLTKTARSGFIALLIGLTLMVVGNFAEYWVLSKLPHEGPGGFVRGLAWMTVLLGLLVMQVASAIVGFSEAKSGHISKWLSVLLRLLLPATIAIGFASLNWAGIPMGIVSIVVGLTGLRQDGPCSSLANRV